MQRSSEIVQPSGFNCYVIIREGNNFTSSLVNPSIACVRQTLLRFEEVPNPARMAQTKLARHRAGAIFRIVVDNQDFPIDGVRHLRSRDAFQSPSQTLATVIGTQNHRNLHEFDRTRISSP